MFALNIKAHNFIKLLITKTKQLPPNLIYLTRFIKALNN
ncbi:Hypothetical protein ABZS17G119_00639 [Kosakonia cowanii]